MRVTAIGWRAHAALIASGGRADVVAPLSTSVYAMAARELVWIGSSGAPLHPRAVITFGVKSPAAGAPLRLVLDGISPWRPPAVAPPFITGPGATRRLQAVLSVGAGRGLLGLGAGLTPSGDDFVGGALFARRLVAIGDAAWEAAVAQIIAEAAAATHPISARLLADLAAGDGWAPLHDLAGALITHDVRAALHAARELTALGHTSGWDLLAGFSAGLGNVPE